jgi:MerR family transcriptional regulator, redox-sensitive transcriptional activator SoxR
VRIGELSEATGVSTRALRYYEQQGLIRSERRANGYREYGTDAVQVVGFIQDLFAAGLSSRIVRDIIPCATDGSGGGPSADLLARVERVRDDLELQEQRLRLRRQTLDTYLADRAASRPPARTIGGC